MLIRRVRDLKKKYGPLKRLVGFNEIIELKGVFTLLGKAGFNVAR